MLYGRLRIIGKSINWINLWFGLESVSIGWNQLNQLQKGGFGLVKDMDSGFAPGNTRIRLYGGGFGGATEREQREDCTFQLLNLFLYVLMICILISCILIVNTYRK